MSADPVGLKSQPCAHAYTEATKTATVITELLLCFQEEKKNKQIMVFAKKMVEIQELSERHEVKFEMSVTNICSVLTERCLLNIKFNKYLIWFTTKKFNLHLAVLHQKVI